MSDMSKPGKKILAKINHSNKLVKALITYDPAYTDSLDWSAEEVQAFKAAGMSDRLSDKLFAFFLIAKRLEGAPVDLKGPQIIVPGVQR